MPAIFVKDNYVISVNYDCTRRHEYRMKHRKDGSFGFNSWRVEENEEKIMNLYTSQDIDLKKFIEQYENGNLTSTKNF